MSSGVEAALDSFNARYEYRTDAQDKWAILDRKDGVVYGDCEDYSMTVLWLLSGQSLWRFWWYVITLRAVIWQASVRGEGHVMLWFKGRGWIDNTTREWNSEPPHDRRFPYIAPLLAMKLLIKRG